MDLKLRWLAGLSMAAAITQAAPAAQPLILGTTAGRPAPLLLELFTSQGCSSCPSAEALLGGWGMARFQEGRLIPLAFHVDYWDSLGWKDPFSSADFTERQRAYVQPLSMDSLYTPQAVIQGQAPFVGSDAGGISGALASLGKMPALTGLGVEAVKKDGKLSVRVRSRVPEKTGGSWVLHLAVFENGRATKVPRGENGGKTLKEDFVVRAFFSKEDPGSQTDLEIPWDPSWDPGRSGVAAYLQDGATMRVDSTAAFYPIR